VEFQISIVDAYDVSDQTEIDFVISAEPRHTVGDLAAALRTGAAGWPPGSPSVGPPRRLYLDGTPLDPATPLAASGIRAGARVGLGGPPADGRRTAHASGAAELRVVSGPDAGLAVPLTPGEHIIGRHGTVRLDNTDVSRKHCRLTVAGDGATFTLCDLESQNGTGLDGAGIGTAPVVVRPGQLIQVGRDVLTIATAAGPGIALRPDPGDPLSRLVNRQMRGRSGLPSPVAIDLGGTGHQDTGRMSWLTMILGPVISVATGVALGAATHQWLFLLIGLGGTAATVIPQLTGKRAAARQSRAARRQLAQAADAGQALLAAAIAAEEQARREALPDPAALAATAIEPGSRLWERIPDGADFLRIRLGTGDLPASTVTVRGQPRGAHAMHAGPPMVADVPVAADLATLGVLGIAGPPRTSYPALAWAVGQLTVAHAPADLRLVLLTENPDAWRWTRWLPHLRPAGGQDAKRDGGWLSTGTDQATRAKRIAELCELIDSRRAGTGPQGPGSGGTGFGGAGFGGGNRAGFGGGHQGAADLGRQRPGLRGQGPAIVVVIDGAAGVRDIRGIDQVIFEGPSAGVFVVIRDDDARELPGCGARLDTDPASGGTGTYTERETGVSMPVRRLDVVSERWADDVARALAPLRDRSSVQEMETGGAVRLNDLFGVDRLTPAVVEDLWQRGGGRTTEVPLGRLAGDALFTLDIARQGPHMLVGGTTGSGKSQFLQTLVASLALGSTPQALNFVLIDYKGGATFQPCRDLPHVSGYLTDLDEHLGRRALTALQAEARYREWLITEKAGCPDIETYWAAGQPCGTLPRLLVIADEFRFLKESLPDVLKGMTDLAARGRTLGMHLVLATQSPAKAINEDIRDNTKLRVCFRVEEKVASVNVIDIPDAAEIDPGLRGRGFARIASGAVAQFQGAWASAPADGGHAAGGEAVAGPLRATPRPFETLGAATALGEVPAERHQAASAGPTDLSELVSAVRATGRRFVEHRAWLDPLPARIPLAAIPPPPGAAGSAGRGGGLLAPIAYGMADLPGEQRQEPLTFDLERDSNLLVGGAALSGRTTALRALAAGIATGCSPADVHLYVLDCNSGALGQLSELPHCGAVVRHADPQRAGRLLDRLDAELDRRRDLLSAGGFATVTEQRGRVTAAERLPYMVLLLDGWDTFTTDLGQIDYGRLAATLTRLLSQGAGAGLRVVVTGGLSALTKLAGSCPQRIVLRLSGPNDIQFAGVPRGAMPANPAEGRGVLLPAACEVQLAFAGSDPSGPAQGMAMNELIAGARLAYPAISPAPLRVEALPSRLPLGQAVSLPGWAGRGVLRAAVAVGGDELGWVGPDLGRVPGFAVAGPIQSGKSTALVVLAWSLLASGTQVIGLAPRESPLRELRGRAGVIEVLTDEQPDPHRLLALLQSAAGPLVVLADDADVLAGQPEVEGLLSGVLGKGRARGWGLVVAGTAAQLGRSTRNFLAAVREHRYGLLLTPEDTQVSTALFNIQLGRSAVFSRPPGRGYLIQAGQSLLVQVPEV
jgi:DNA segregation ATPase FtsK/SpoIIIE, S-DNA-T family